MVLVNIIVYMLLLAPAGVIAAIAYMTMDQSTRRGAIKRLWTLAVLTAGALAFGYFGTRAGSTTPEGCTADDCMFDVDGLFDDAMWIVVGAMAFVLVLFALQTVGTLAKDAFGDSAQHHPPGGGPGHPPGGMQDRGKTD